MFGLQGTVTYREYDKESGLLLSEGVNHNRIVDIGVGNMWSRLTTTDALEELVLKPVLYIGSDFGGSGWSVFNPQPAGRDFTVNDQDAFLSVTRDAMFGYPSQHSFMFSCTIDGDEIMNTPTYENDITITFNSLTIRNQDGEAFAYIRVPVRTIARQTVATVEWLFEAKNKEQYCEEQTP